MQSTKTASITNTVAVSAEEVRALVGVAAKNFAGVVDGQGGVKLLSSDVIVREDGSAEVAIVYQQAAVPAPATEEKKVAEQPLPAFVPGLTIPVVNT